MNKKSERKLKTGGKKVKRYDSTSKCWACGFYGHTRRIEKFRIASVWVKTPYTTKKMDMAVLSSPCAELIIGNQPGLKEMTDHEIKQWEKENIPEMTEEVRLTTQRQETNAIMEDKSDSVNLQEIENVAAVTRSVTKKQQTQEHSISMHKEQIPITTADENTRKIFYQEQKNDLTLTQCFEATKREPRKTKNAEWKFKVDKGILSRIYSKRGRITKQTVLPLKFREKAISLAHDSIFSGHMGVTKTKSRLLSSFFWPGYSKDIKSYVQSCDICLRTSKKGETPKAPVQSGQLASRPFQEVAVDIIGPLSVVSAKGNRYIFTLIDLASRWPEAWPLRTITAEDIQEVLLQIFSRIGFPEVIISDRGTQFTSVVTRLETRKDKQA
ncbi:unnamed protein product [Candidula unifasciata]|uniref:Integrase catalytic domain-containing protein n=1 Tax=Candidula unifasciata TaxID=100452 RepID=A0A8S3ZA66_9EUPU|nr:unnamed protein product [Candidula unifasciata]